MLREKKSSHLLLEYLNFVSPMHHLNLFNNVISSRLQAAQYCFFVFGFKRVLLTSSEESTCKSGPAKKIRQTDTCDSDDVDNGVVNKVAIKERKGTVDNNKRYSGMKER